MEDRPLPWEEDRVSDISVNGKIVGTVDSRA
jgi:hypothetical protein